MAAKRLIQAAYAYLYIGDFAEAKAAFERAIQAEPNNPHVYFCASVTAHRSGDYARAKECIQKAMQLSPGIPLYESYYDAICASSAVEEAKWRYVEGYISEAISLLKEATRQDPLNEDAQNMLAELTALHCSWHEGDTKREDIDESEHSSYCSCGCKGEDGS
ncbi:hypothetical protein AAC03nite_29000 [Alicyclobacillus acidoterrestris]|nr:hypothetical protein AAC03nite_29000 [Alicyclobacillus acidoterrestris]